MSVATLLDLGLVKLSWKFHVINQPVIAPTRPETDGNASTAVG
jgi:hypothetical protein